MNQTTGKTLARYGLLIFVAVVTLLNAAVTAQFGAEFLAGAFGIDNPFVARIAGMVYAVVMFDVAALTWLFVYMRHAESTAQRALSIVGAVASFIGSLIATAYMLSANTSGALAAYGDTVATIAQVSMIGVVIMHAVLGVGFVLTGHQERILQTAIDAHSSVLDQSLKDARDNINTLRPTLAAAITRQFETQILGELGFTQDPGGGIRYVSSNGRFTESILPAGSSAAPTPTPTAAPAASSGPQTLPDVGRMNDAEIEAQARAMLDLIPGPPYWIDDFRILFDQLSATNDATLFFAWHAYEMASNASMIRDPLPDLPGDEMRDYYRTIAGRLMAPGRRAGGWHRGEWRDDDQYLVNWTWRRRLMDCHTAAELERVKDQIPDDDVYEHVWNTYTAKLATFGDPAPSRAAVDPGAIRRPSPELKDFLKQAGYTAEELQRMAQTYGLTDPEKAFRALDRFGYLPDGMTRADFDRLFGELMDGAPARPTPRPAANGHGREG